METRVFLKYFVRCLSIVNIVNSNYQQNSRALHTFVSSKSFGQKLDISPQNVIFSKPFGSEFLYIYILKYGLLTKLLNQMRWKII